MELNPSRKTLCRSWVHHRQKYDVSTSSNTLPHDYIYVRVFFFVCFFYLSVGAGESGKSTIVKQMKILHKDGYTDA